MSQNNFEYYQEITLIPSEEIDNNFLMNKIFSKLHLIIADFRNKGMVDIGISFPNYSEKDFTLGNKIRVFFEKFEQGNILMLKDEFRNYYDYIHISNIRDIPAVHGYAIFSRVQKHKNKLRLARRAAKRQNLNFSDIIDNYEECTEPKNLLPYVKIYSSSTKQNYSICIKKTECEYKSGNFNYFGLSNNASVPMF